MRIPPSSTSFTSPAQQPVLFGGTTTLLAKNLRRVQKDFLYNIQNDSISFQNNALIYASLLLVISRLYAANKSIKQAKGTVDENYRKSEAIKTSLREIGGFSFSFLVLRVIQAITASKIAKFFGLDTYNSLRKYTAKHFNDAFTWTFIKKEPLYVKQGFLTPGLLRPKGSEQINKMVEYYSGLNLDRFFKEKALHLPETEKVDQVFKNIRTMHRYVPIIVGSIPAVIFSGFLLEHFTQKHANSLTLKVRNWLDNNQKKNPPLNGQSAHRKHL